MKLLHSTTFAASVAIAIGVSVSVAGTQNPATKQNSAPATPASHASSPVPRLKGTVMSSDTWSQGNQPFGFYHIPTRTGEDFEIITTLESNEIQYLGTFGHFEQNGFYFVSDRLYDGFLYNVTHYVYEASTGNLINSFQEYGDCSKVAIDCAKDPTDGTIYAATYDSGGYGYQLSKLNFSTTSAQSTRVGYFNCEIAALACDSKGQLYAITRERDKNKNVTGSTLLKVNKTDASYEKIGSGTGLLPRYLSSATIDTRFDRMYWTVNPPDDSGALYEVDLQTGKASLIVNFPGNEQVVGLVADGYAANDKSPAAPENLKVTFDGGTLSGKLSCDVPAYTFDGQPAPASGQVKYTVTVDGSIAGQGNVTYGDRITCDVKVNRRGEHKFSVCTSNNAGESPKTSVTAFAGFGTPSAPTNVVAEWKDGTATITWSPVATSIDGGYINQADVTYTVTRTDGSTAASGLKTTTFSEPLAEPSSPTSVKYRVAAVNDAYSSEATQSNVLALGAIVPPFTTVFSQGEHTLDDYTVIDANKDNRTWIWDDKGHGVRAPYNTDHITPMDDWLITPGIKLKAGYVYDLTFDASVMQADCEETFEVMMGNGNTVEAMATSLIPSTTIANTQPKRQTVRVIPEEDGTYFIGIHCISGPDKYYLFINNLSVSAPQPYELPDQPTDLIITPGAGGALKADISFKTPDKDLSGNNLSSLSKVVVERNGTPVKTFTSPKPGDTLSCTDNLPSSGEYTYTVAGYSANGRGREVSGKAYVGIGAPARPEVISLEENGDTGEVTVKWNPVTTDVNGMDLTPDKVTYSVRFFDTFEYEWTDVKAGLTGTSYTFKCLDDTADQKIVCVGIVASTEGGDSEIGKSPMAAVGSPYKGLRESFAHCGSSYAWHIDGTCESYGLFTDNTIQSCASYDGDNGYVYMRASALDQYGLLQSGKIDLSGMSNPGLTFYTYNFVSRDGDRDTNVIEVSVRGADGTFRQVFGSTVTDIAGNDSPAGWCKCHIPLEDYAGQTVEFIVKGQIKSFSYVMLDNFMVNSPTQADLGVSGFTVPMMAKAGSGYQIQLSVSNEGVTDASGWSADLFADGEKHSSLEGPDLRPGETATLTFDMTMSPVAIEATEFHAVVNYADDDDLSNNTAPALAIEPVVPHHPVATGLTAAENANGIDLSWNAPDLPVSPQKVAEDFEKANSFAQEYADWKFSDLDNTEIAGFREFEIPGITNWSSKVSFFVFDRRRLNLGSQFSANSGDKYLASLSLWDDSQVNDWAISPELSGNAQTVSFYARSFQSQYPEAIEVLYSTGSLNPDDFRTVNDATQVPGEWTRYEANLPQGAKHFAIRSCAAGNFMLMLDDIAFEAKPLGEKYTVTGYNVYRNGEKINAEPVKATSHTDNDAPEGTNTYVVTTVYNLGESAPSDAVEVKHSGIEEISVGGSDEGTVYYNLQGIRVENPAKGGIYIRRQGGKTEKVMVK